MPNDKVIELSLNTLRVLLFGDESLEGHEVHSRAIGDTGKVVVIPTAIGQILRTIDHDEEYFHIEFPDNVDQAEIWLSFEWKESNVRRTRMLAHSAEQRVFREKNNSRLARLTEKLSSQGYNRHPGYAAHLANLILKKYRSGAFNDALKVLDIADTLAEFDKEDNENKA